MRKISYVFMAVLTMVIAIAGCQSTPDKPVVIQKDMAQMIEKAQTTATSEETPGMTIKERVGAPDAFVFESTEGNFTVSANAPVFVPESEGMPIIRVKAGEFTQEEVSAFWYALVGDTVLWRRETGLTKSEIEAQLVNLRMHIAEYEDDPEYENIVEQTKADIKELEAQYATAPDEIEMTVADSTLRETEMGVNEDTYICASAGGNTEDYSMSFYVQNMTRNKAGDIINPASMGFSTSDANHNYGQVNTLVVDENTELDESMKAHIKTTPAQAKAIVEEFLKKTGTPMEITSMKLVNDEETGIYDDVVAPAEHYAYSLMCFRVVNKSLPCARILGSTYIENEDLDYMKTWDFETMGFKVNDSGIISMEWRAPLELIETTVEDCELMPFSEIQGVFEKMIPITYEATAKDMDNLTCRIEDVRLEMMRVVEQGSIENGLLIPVWNFYGVRERTYKGEKDETGRYILLCVNAIDGSVIDISKGY